MKLKQSGANTSALKNSYGHKSHKLLWVIIVIIVIFLALPVLVAGWLGFVPGLSNLMGSADPKDLGVRYSQQDVDSYKQKTTIAIKDYSLAPQDPKNPAEKSVLANPKSVNEMNLTQEEITAAINSTGWTWMPVENTQVRITDGTIEISGKLNLDRIDEFSQYISDSGNNDQDVKNSINWAKRLTNNAPVYAKANAIITNNVLSFKLLEAQIGRLDIPLGKVGNELSNGGTQAIINADNFSVNSAELLDNNLLFTGVYPATIYLKQ